MILFVNKVKIKWEWDNFIEKKKKKRQKHSIIVNFLNHYLGYKTEDTIYESIVRVKIKKNNTKKYNKNNEC